jgi:hypothetical protein
MDLQQFIADLNDTWRAARYDDLAAFFAEGVGLLPQGYVEPIVGVPAMVESYRQFGAEGKVHRFDVTEEHCHLFPGVAIYRLHFEVDYEIDSGRYVESGLETYTISLASDAPKIVWRTQLIASYGKD